MPKKQSPQLEMTRCAWAGHDALMKKYHDEEWGRPVHDSESLFEKLILDGFQAGLSWRTILHRRDTLRRAFSNFSPRAMAQFDEDDVARLMQDPGIIRNQLKVRGAIKSARAYRGIEERDLKFGDFLWAIIRNYPESSRAAGAPIPTESEASRQMSRALKKAGFTFCGPVICYAFMQAVGMVSDHEETCFLAGT